MEDKSTYADFVKESIDSRRQLAADLEREEIDLRARELAIRRKEIENMIKNLQSFLDQENVPILKEAVKLSLQATKELSYSERNLLKEDQLRHDAKDYQYEWDDRYAFPH